MSDAQPDDDGRDGNDGMRFGDDGPELLAAPVVAAMFGRGLRTLRNWEGRGLLTSKLIAGRRYYFRSSVLALLRPADA